MKKHPALSSRLKVERAKRGLTLTDAAEEIGIERHALSKIERGLVEASIPTIHKVADAYELPIEELLALAEAPVEEVTTTSGKVEGSVEEEAEAEPQVVKPVWDGMPARLKLSPSERERLERVLGLVESHDLSREDAMLILVGEAPSSR